MVVRLRNSDEFKLPIPSAARGGSGYGVGVLENISPRQRPQIAMIGGVRAGRAAYV